MVFCNSLNELRELTILYFKSTEQSYNIKKKSVTKQICNQKACSLCEWNRSTCHYTPACDFVANDILAQCSMPFKSSSFFPSK